MKITKNIFTVLFFLYYFTTINAQLLPVEFSFDSDLDGWTSSTLSNIAHWEWQPDGKADLGLDWNDRSAIQSVSGGGAVVFDADGNIASGNDDGTGFYDVALTSPSLDLSAYTSAYLSFHQYFRKSDLGGETTNGFVEISTDDGINWTNIYDTASIPQGFETSAADRQIIDISSYTGNTSVQIRFRFVGSNYFSIMDDIDIDEDYPYPVTLPAYVGDTLTSFGYPWHPDKPVDASPYVLNQVVVQFADGVSAVTKAAIRDTLGAIKIDSCVCDKLELWEFIDSMIVPNSMFPNGGTIGIHEKVKGAKTKTEIDGIDLNRYNYNELVQHPMLPEFPLLSIPSNIPISPSNIPTIAILDTGVDYNHENLTNYIHRSTETLNQTDSDSNFLIDDPIGWNFVHNNNNPFDDHSHGTSVAGIIAQQVSQNNPNCNFRIRPYKTHDNNGFSTVFQVTCGTYQAIKDDVSVMNDSWGFYGDSYPMLWIQLKQIIF